MHNALQPLFVQDHGNWPQVAALLPHAIAVLDQARDDALGADIIASLCTTLDLYFDARGDYTRATPYSERALGIRETALGPEHPDVANSLNNLAGLYDAQGRYEAAGPLYEHALGIRETALGPEHPAVATSLNNLAELYRAQGRDEAAGPLFERALGICEKSLGPDHPTTKTVRANYEALKATMAAMRGT